MTGNLFESSTTEQHLLKRLVDQLDADVLHEKHHKQVKQKAHHNHHSNRKTILRKDVYWQTSEPVSSNKMDLQIFLSDHLSDGFDSLGLVNELIEQPLQIDTNSVTTSTCFLDNNSVTSSTSDDSLDSLEESYQITSQERLPKMQDFMKIEHTSATETKPPKPQYTRERKTNVSANRRKSEGNSRNRIDPLYSNDPYLQRHRLMVNARQKNRMMKINNMYNMLGTLIPDHVVCEPNVKPHSKLGILKRTIVYWRSLSNLLVVPENAHSNIDNSLLADTSNIKTEQNDMELLFALDSMQRKQEHIDMIENANSFTLQHL